MGVGFTSANAGGAGTSFVAEYENLKITGNGVGDQIDPPADPSDAISILQALDGVDDNGSYGEGAEGSAILTIIDGSNNVQSSNFGSNSFELTNTGDKQIAAVVIDFRNAVFGDSVVDFDGTAGDTSAKKFAVNTEGGTGAFFGPDADTYLFAGDTPLENTTGGGNTPATGGFRGVLIQFDGSSGGFANGETVGFSGDMDPNSIAGLLKSGSLGVDTGATNGWDVGGVSGAELIGSSFTVMYDDGTFSTGYVGSDESQAGSAGETVQGRAEQTATLTIDTGLGVVSSGQTGVYGPPVPTITVNGPANATVRVVLQKGFQPVNNDAGGTEALVEARLAADQSDFQVNNAFDVQTFDVTLDGSGTATLPASAFDYNNTDSGESFTGDNVQPLAFTAAVLVDATDGSAIAGSDDQVPLGPVSQPIYLTNTGGPVDGSGGDDGGDLGDGYYEGIDTGGGFRFKVQIEDENGVGGGQNPGGKWNFVDAPDEEGRQAGFQGDGYYLFGSDTSTALNGVNANETIKYRIFIPDSETGTYNFRIRVSRDGVAASDQQNDLWFHMVKEDDPSFNFEEALVSGSNEAEPTSQGYVKVFGGPNNGDWGFTGSVDGAPGNFGANVAIEEGGFYIVEIAGRSQGFHVDWWELNNGGNPGEGASNSQFITDGDPDDPIDPIDPVDPADFTATAGGADDIEIPGSVGSSDLETDKTIIVRLEVPAGAGTVTEVETALVSFVSERTHSGAADLTFSVKDDITQAGFNALDAAPAVGGTQTVAVSGTWQDNEPIENIVDLAPQVNALIASQGPLEPGDYINVEINGSGATRFIVQGSVELGVTVPDVATTQSVGGFEAVGGALNDKFVFDEVEDAAWTTGPDLMVDPVMVDLQTADTDGVTVIQPGELPETEDGETVEFAPLVAMLDDSPL